MRDCKRLLMIGVLAVMSFGQVSAVTAAVRPVSAAALLAGDETVVTKGKSISEFVLPDGRIDLAELRESGYQGPLDFDGTNIRVDQITGEPIVQSGQVSSSGSASNPDDVYWDNSISPSIPGVNGTVFSLSVFGGQLIVGGSFGFAGTVAAYNIAAWDGVSWSALGTGMSGPVRDLTVYDKKLIAGGSFTTAGGVSANYIAAWDGVSWSALGTGMNGYVSTLTVYDNKLIAGGWFTTAGGISANYIAAWDGVSWSALGTGMNRYVSALTVYDNKLIAGGSFTTAGGVSANYIAAWDGVTWSALGTGMSYEVDALTVYDNKLIAGGWFTTAGGVSANNIAAWDGVSWSALGTGINGYVSALTVYDNKLIAGGVFTGVIAAWDGVSWSALGTGMNGYVSALTVYDNKLIAGGVFTGVIAAWDGVSWSALGTGMNGYVSALTVYDNKLIAGGNFAAAGGVSANSIAAWNGESWSTLGIGLSGIARALCVHDNKLIAGDDVWPPGWGFNYTTVVKTWNGSSWSDLGIRRYGSVRSIIAYQDKLVIDRVTYGGVECIYTFPHIETWDGVEWQGLIDLREVYPSNMVIYDGKLLIGGDYEDPCFDEPIINGPLGSWDGTSWNILESLPVYALTVYHDKLYGAVVSGYYPNNLGYYVAVWDGQTWSLVGEEMNGIINTLGVYDNKLIAAGRFTSIGSSEVNHIAFWDGDTWSGMGSGTNGNVLSMTVYQGDLVIGGVFTTAGGEPSPYLAVWTKRDTLEVALDVKPGSCPNPINGNSAHGQGKAVLPVAIMGSAEFDVHDIDPATVVLNGISPIRWNYEDVGGPTDKANDECACSDAGPDGYEDMTLKFHSSEIAASLGGNNLVTVEGQLKDGSSFEGQDCVTLVGHGAMKAETSADQERSFELMGNYPNPFNPSTQISFYLPEPTHVLLEIFNILGQRVTTLVDGEMPAGRQFLIWDASSSASGIYYYRLTAGDKTATNKMLLLK